jgi:hypothetical protein
MSRGWVFDATVFDGAAAGNRSRVRGRGAVAVLESMGPFGDDPRPLDAGTRLLVMAGGPGNVANRDGARTVKVRVLVGQHAGQIVLVERSFCGQDTDRHGGPGRGQGRGADPWGADHP